MPAFRSLLPFALVASLTSANAEILLLDDFTVPLDFNTVQITGNDTSMSGQVGNYLWLQQGTQASWQDTGSTDHVIGGTRSVEVSSLALDTPILDHVKIAREAGLPYVYLGYWVPGSPKMGYKSRFSGLEVYRDGGWECVTDADAYTAERHPLSTDPIAEQVARIELPGGRPVRR